MVISCVCHSSFLENLISNGCMIFKYQTIYPLLNPSPILDMYIASGSLPFMYSSNFYWELLFVGININKYSTDVLIRKFLTYIHLLP